MPEFAASVVTFMRPAPRAAMVEATLAVIVPPGNATEVVVMRVSPGVPTPETLSLPLHATRPTRAAHTTSRITVRKLGGALDAGNNSAPPRFLGALLADRYSARRPG